MCTNAYTQRDTRTHTCTPKSTYTHPGTIACTPLIGTCTRARAHTQTHTEVIEGVVRSLAPDGVYLLFSTFSPTNQDKDMNTLVGYETTLCVCVSARARTCTSTRTHTHTHSLSRACTHAHTHSWPIHSYTRAYTHTHTHTHSHGHIHTISNLELGRSNLQSR